METIDMILYIIFQMVELLRYLFVFSGIFGFQKTENKKKILSVFISFLGLSGILYKHFLDLDFFILPIVFCIILLIVFERRSAEKICIFICVNLCFNFIDQTIAVLAGMLFGFNPLLIIDYENMSYKFAVILPSFIVLGIIAFKKRKDIKRQNLSFGIPKRIYCLIILSLLSIVLLMSLISYIAFVENKDVISYFLQGTTVFAIAAVIIVLALIFYLSSYIRTQQMQKQMLELLEKKYEMQNEYYQRLYQKNEEMRGFRHDYHHHITYLLSQMKMKNYEQVEEYLCSINDIGNEIIAQNEVYSGNRVIDAIIYGIISKEENKDIVFHYKGKVSRQLRIKDIDLSIILSNALENAAEACRQCKTKKEIDMMIARHNENILIQIHNTFDSDKSGKVNLYSTTKRDKENHGYGTINMLQSIERYDGTLENKVEKEMFCLRIQLNEKA